MLKFVKQIRDPVLGWIWLTEEEVRLIDSCPFVQRLRYVMQLGLAHLVYPTARHTRFEHCLGVMHLATKMFQSLLEQPVFRQHVDKLLDVFNIRDQKVEGLLQHLRIAALLHDLGHYPFSHSLDNFLAPLLYNVLSRDPELLPELGLDADVLEVLKVITFGLSIAKEHEWITYFLLTRNRDLAKCIEEAAPNIDIRVVKDILFANMLSKLCELDVKIEYIPDVQRITKYTREELMLIKFVSSIISSSLDADRIDYMLRDLYFTGASVSTNITLSDVERILSNIYVTQDRDGKMTVVFDEKARACLEGFVIARYNLYKWVYLHHKVTLMTSLMRTFYTLLVNNIRKLLDEELIKRHIQDIAKFSTGVLEGARALELTDYYVYTMMTLCYDKLSKIFGRAGTLILDSLLYRRTSFKPLWKRDVEFEHILRNAAATDVTVFNRKIGILIYESSKRPFLMFALQEAFRTRLVNELNLAILTGAVQEEKLRRCIEEVKRRVEEDFTSFIVLGYAYFEPEVSISITSSSQEPLTVIDLMEISPLTKSVKEAWERSPKLFIYINHRDLREICGDCFQEALAVLRRCIVQALESAVRDVLNVHTRATA